MGATIRSELLKLATVRTTAGLASAAVLIAGLLALGVSSVAGEGGNPSIGDPLFLRNLLAGPSLALVTAIVGGVLMSSGEFHHGTAVPTFLATPRRDVVMAAKAVVAVVLGLALATVALATTTAVGSLLAAREGVALLAEVSSTDLRMIATTFALGSFYGVAGMALGALVRNQVGAIGIAIAWSQLIETSVIPTFAPDLAGWMPSGLFASLSGAVRPDLLSVTTAGALLPVYTVGLVAVAWWVLDRADLT